MSEKSLVKIETGVLRYAVPASNVFVYTKTLLRCKMLVREAPQTPLFCIFQCRLRVPAGRFLSDDTFRVIENLHKVRCSFCQRSILHLFRDRRIQKRNAPFLHTVRKLFLRQQCSLPAHLRESVSVQNVGNMKSAVAIFRQLHHGIVVNPEMAEPEPTADVLHVMAEIFFTAPLWHFGENALQLLIYGILFVFCSKLFCHLQ